ncbi:enoyl-CoA hydratase/isomerase family protein [uncultured Nocardioides sp.]|uniref:enoyl-CoA hydratase/isomerase family protein n=1 Tax=uncultured Nocardioides sp. TaxID=198441 RepID=UPI002607ED71|nr:enoyl-CoA hydratase/isomerase family protein [uncultured Nocardioides sp.]
MSVLELAAERALRGLIDDYPPWGELWVVDLTGSDDLDVQAIERVVAAADELPGIVVGVAEEPVPSRLAPVLEALSFTLAPSGPGSTWVAVDDTSACLAEIEATVTRSPLACQTLRTLLGLTDVLSARDGVVAESLAYSTLLAGPEFAAWLAARPSGAVAPDPSPAVRVSRLPGDVLEVTLDRPARHNAFSAQMRDELLAALDVAKLDPTVVEVVLRGAGPSFCAGGDLAEFGTTPDPATAHLVRVARSAGLAVNGLVVDRLGARVRVELHGACIGAGIEIPAFAETVVATPDAWFRLPELSMGLVPGAGGTVSIPRRIGRWRTAWLLLTGRDLAAATALEWGLVDVVG